MIRRLRSLFAWRVIRRDNHHRYEENTVTGARRIVRFNYTRGWPAAPADEGWVAGLEFGEAWKRMQPPPRPER